MIRITDNLNKLAKAWLSIARSRFGIKVVHGHQGRLLLPAWADEELRLSGQQFGVKGLQRRDDGQQFGV